MTKEARSIRCPEGVLGWIPWYGEEGDDGQGVLSHRQRGAVEAHCAECADCRAELDMISGAPYEIDVDLPDPDRLFAEITARIEAGEARTPEADSAGPVIPIDHARKLEDSEYGKLAAWILDEGSEAEVEAEPSNVVPGPWARRSVLAAAAVALLCLGGLGGALFAPSGPGVSPGSSAAVYELATADAPAQLDAPKLDVIFDNDASAGQIFEALRAAGVEIIAGPSDQGVYRLQLVPTDEASPRVAGAAGASQPQDVSRAAEIAALLKAAPTPIVLFAEPVP